MPCEGKAAANPIKSLLKKKTNFHSPRHPDFSKPSCRHGNLHNPLLDGRRCFDFSGNLTSAMQVFWSPVENPGGGLTLKWSCLNGATRKSTKQRCNGHTLHCVQRWVAKQRHIFGRRACPAAQDKRGVLWEQPKPLIFPGHKCTNNSTGEFSWHIGALL